MSESIPSVKQKIKMEEGSDSSDAELEAALQVEPESDIVEPTTTSAQFQSLPQQYVTSQPGPSISSPFKAPPNPSIPQDLSLIMEMVAKNEVVGSLPPISMSAAEKRRLVEESLKTKINGTDKGKEKEAGEILEENHNSQSEDMESDSDSSSEFVTSSESESDHEDLKIKNEPMNEEKHEQLKKELDEFVKSSNEVELDSDDDVESDSDEDEDEDISFPGLDKMGFEFMEDDEDDGPSNSGPIFSIHEAPLPSVPQPPLMKLPEGEGVSLAGDVVSWMREKKVEVWLEKKKLEEESSKVTELAQGESSELEKNVEEVKKEDLKNDNQIQVDQLAQDDTVKSNPVSEEGIQGGTLDNSKDEEGQIVEDITAPFPAPSVAKPKPQEPRFISSGTVVVRAMQSRPGAADEGWLEEGSVLCWEDGRVLGTVHETFGPLTSPFYTIRLPPPPFPYPSPESLTNGTKLYYPLNPSFRSFVNMLAVRDPRFKGSDASNIYDEEIGEDEIEWSDDELEAEAKKRRKQRKGSKAPNNNNNPKNKGKGRENNSIPGLPQRPHFDYHPDQQDDISETGSLYGGDENWEGMSDAGMSTISSRGRNLPEPYDLDEPQTAQSGQSGQGGSNNNSNRGNGRGRGQGRDRGGGRGKNRGRGGNSQRGGRGDSNSTSTNQPTRQQFSLPINPMLNQQIPSLSPQQQNYNQSYIQQQQYYPQQNYSYSPQQQQNFTQFPYQQQQQQQSYSQMQFPQQSYTNNSNSNNDNDTYEPNQPSTGMPSYQNQSSYSPYAQQTGYGQSGYNPQQQQQQQQQQQLQQNYQSQNPGVPAINPRFAAQYSQLMNNQSQQNQGYEYGYQGHQGQNDQYSE